jgi:hypothetical protein
MIRDLELRMRSDTGSDRRGTSGIRRSGARFCGRSPKKSAHTDGREHLIIDIHMSGLVIAVFGFTLASILKSHFFIDSQQR